MSPDEQCVRPRATTLRAPPARSLPCPRAARLRVVGRLLGPAKLAPRAAVRRSASPRRCSTWCHHATEGCHVPGTGFIVQASCRGLLLGTHRGWWPARPRSALCAVVWPAGSKWTPAALEASCTLKDG